MRRGGLSKFSVENFLSQSAEKIRRGTLLCFRKFRVPKIVRDKRRGGYHDFLSKLFCLTVPKKFVGEPFSVSLISGIEKVWMRGWGGGVSRFSVEKFFSHSAEKFRRATL